MNQNNNHDKINPAITHAPTASASNKVNMPGKKKPAGTEPNKEFPTECNPDNNAWHEGLSNPLSSKGN